MPRVPCHCHNVLVVAILVAYTSINIITVNIFKKKNIPAPVTNAQASAAILSMEMVATLVDIVSRHWWLLLMEMVEMTATWRRKVGGGGG
jgi:hypothetical protein